MGWEIDFLHLGESKKSADAITLRFGDLMGSDRGKQTVVVIDGGFKTNGEAIVKHVKKYYMTSRVDLVVSTHPDTDHASGLCVVLEELTVKELWMHQPWKHTQDIANLFKDGRVTDRSIRESLRESLDDAMALEELATRKGIPIVEPFCGVKDRTNNLYVVGPTVEFYESLLPELPCLPEPVAVSAYRSIFEQILAETKETLKTVAESWGIETLDDTGETTAQNNSSVILIAAFEEDGKKQHIMLTADAGMPALADVADRLDVNGYSFTECLYLVQVPHHGSRRNVGPTILNRILGPKLPTNQQSAELRRAIVSICKGEEPKHPSKKVLNAFRRRGVPVYSNMDRSVWWRSGAPPRADYTDGLMAFPLYSQVEE
jgi:beta-lactamase superfamily II metal-dependent hydrolase